MGTHTSARCIALEINRDDELDIASEAREKRKAGEKRKEKRKRKIYKFPNQICYSHPDSIEQTTNVHFIPPLTINKDKKNEVLKYKLILSLRPL